MTSVLIAVAYVVAAALVVLLLATLAFKPLRIWPTPGEKTWQSYVFWPLFRGLNVLCFVAALVDRTPFLALPLWLRALAFVVLLVSTAVFVYAFRMLGRDNSYGASEGLVTSGIYQWSRNPQNAMLMVVYAALAVAADSAATTALCAAMIAVYFLMVLAEEPWLEAIYGDAYRAYCRAIPRFFNWRKLLNR